MNGVREWGKKHLMTSTFIIIHIICSIIYLLFSFNSPFLLIFFRLFGSCDLGLITLNIIFLLLFSGVEVSVGQKKYLFWMLWSAFFVLIGRILLSQFSSEGPSFLIYSTYFTFLFIHRPMYYFKLFKYSFSDTLLYTLGIIQYTAYNPINHPVDALSCIIANILLKVFAVVSTKLLRCRETRANGNNPDNTNNIIQGDALQLDEIE